MMLLKAREECMNLELRADKTILILITPI